MEAKRLEDEENGKEVLKMMKEAYKERTGSTTTK